MSGTDTNPVGATAEAVTIGTTARGVIVIEAERGKSYGHQRLRRAESAACDTDLASFLPQEPT